MFDPFALSILLAALWSLQYGVVAVPLVLVEAGKESCQGTGPAAAIAAVASAAAAAAVAAAASAVASVVAVVVVAAASAVAAVAFAVAFVDAVAVAVAVADAELAQSGLVSLLLQQHSVFAFLLPLLLLCSVCLLTSSGREPPAVPVPQGQDLSNSACARAQSLAGRAAAPSLRAPLAPTKHINHTNHTRSKPVCLHKYEPGNSIYVRRYTMQLLNVISGFISQIQFSGKTDSSVSPASFLHLRQSGLSHWTHFCRIICPGTESKQQCFYRGRSCLHWCSACNKRWQLSLREHLSNVDCIWLPLARLPLHLTPPTSLLLPKSLEIFRKFRH